MNPYEPAKSASEQVKPGLSAIARARRARSKGRRWIVITSVISLVCVSAIVFVFGLRPSPPEPAIVAAPDSSPSAQGTDSAAAPWPVRVILRQGAVLIDGNEIARTEAIVESGRLTKVDGLFNALKERRFAHPTDNPAVIFEVSRDTPALVVKSAFQTAAFAGCHDVRFDVDGNIIGRQR